MGQGSKADNAPLTISRDAIIENIGNVLLGQRQMYRNAGTQDNLNEVGVPSEIGLHSWLEMEHVDGSLCTFIGNQDLLKNSTSVFPVFCKENTKIQARTVIYNAMVADPRYQSLVPSNEPLPERSTLKGDALKQRDEEEKIRNFHEQNLNARAEQALQLSNVNEGVLFRYFLIACRQKAELWENIAAPSALASNQWVIPLRINASHFTLIVVHFGADKNATIQYYNSTGAGIQQSILTSLREYLKSQGLTQISYEKKSKREQIGEGVNCGVFVFYNAVRLLCENKRIPNLLPEWIPAGSSINSRQYRDVLAYYRRYIAGLLQSSGQNVSLENDLTSCLQRTEVMLATTRQKELQRTLIELLKKKNTSLDNETSTAINKQIQKINQEIVALNNVVCEPMPNVPASTFGNNEWDEFFTILKDLSWPSVILIALGLSIIGLFLIPFTYSIFELMFTQMSSLLSTSPLVNFLLGGIVFTGAIALWNAISDCIGEQDSSDQSMAEELTPLNLSASAGLTDQHLPEHVPGYLPSQAASGPSRTPVPLIQQDIVDANKQDRPKNK